MNDKRELKEYVRSVMIQGGSAPVDEEIVQQIVETAGSNFLMLKNLANSPNVQAKMQTLLDTQIENLTALSHQKEAYELLMTIAKGEKLIRFMGSKSSHLLLLSQRDTFDPLCGVHPDGHLILAMPVTKVALQIMEQAK